MAAAMLAAYYSCECDSRDLLSPYEIARSEDFEKYLNQYNTIFLNMQEFMSQSRDMDGMLDLIRRSVFYNDENALSYTISLALYAARNFYTIHREMAGGKGFADLVFIPRRRYRDKPALVVELKWDRNARGALEQIKAKGYCRSLEEYHGNLLLVGVNYDRKTKEHECVIEEYVVNV